MSGPLRRDNGFDDADAVYQALVTMLEGLSEEDSRLVLAKFALLLANHVGDRQVIDEAIAAARAGTPGAEPKPKP